MSGLELSDAVLDEYLISRNLYSHLIMRVTLINTNYKYNGILDLTPKEK